MYMKKLVTLLFVIALAFSSLMVNAQEPDEQGDRYFNKERQEAMEAKKVSFITEKMELTPEEAATFWPIYNDHEKERRQLNSSMHDLIRVKHLKKDDILKLSDAEAQKIIDGFKKFNKDQYELDAAFLEKLQIALPPQKVIKFFELERTFKRFLLNEIRKNNPERRRKNRQ